MSTEAALFAPKTTIPDRMTIPERLDKLPWSRWHLRFVLALGVTWLLDGLEGSLGGSLAGALKSRSGLSLTDAQLGLSSSVYLAGAVVGSIVLGLLADRFGRRKIFFWTLIGYLAATTASGAAWSLTSFTIDRKSTRLNSSHQHRSRMPSSA